MVDMDFAQQNMRLTFEIETMGLTSTAWKFDKLRYEKSPTNTWGMPKITEGEWLKDRGRELV